MWMNFPRYLGFKNGEMDNVLRGIALKSALFESALESLPLLRRGKVRDIYTIDSDQLLIVASDRLSAFDVVLPTPIPDKGRILTTMSNFWCSLT
jgi:phosphoribosylaminoimidazole-succinocarboxamide synthase